MSMSVWLKPRTLDPLRAQRVAGVGTPSLAAVSGLAILLIGYERSVSWSPCGLATGTCWLPDCADALGRDLRILTKSVIDWPRPTN